MTWQETGPTWPHFFRRIVLHLPSRVQRRSLASLKRLESKHHTHDGMVDGGNGITYLCYPIHWLFCLWRNVSTKKCIPNKLLKFLRVMGCLRSLCISMIHFHLTKIHGIHQWWVSIGEGWIAASTARAGSGRGKRCWDSWVGKIMVLGVEMSTPRVSQYSTWIPWVPSFSGSIAENLEMFFWCFWWGQVFVWELSTNKSGMSWESLEGFFFNLEMVSVLYMDIVPGWLSKRQERLRAQAEQRVREQGSSGKETERLRSGKKITKGFATNHKLTNPRILAEVCVFFFIFKVIQGFVSREMFQYLLWKQELICKFIRS